jgi:fused signal recognition particle receptor
MTLLGRLFRNRGSLAGSLSRLFSPGRVDEEVLASAEKVLIEADLGCEITDRILDRLRRNPGRESSWKAEVCAILLDSLPPSRPAGTPARPDVSMFVGVNGSGKTTTIARLAWRAGVAGRKPLLACADTFRAAAAEQLSLWGERMGIEVFSGKPGADPGAVAYDSILRARSAGHDCVLIDTAGRLPNQKGLLDELAKIHRVCGKAMEGAPHSVLLVLDGSVGQNALSQGEHFGGALPVSGLVLTKLDGTAKGGSVLALSSKLGIPIEYIGVGEAKEDLLPFDPVDFIEALLEDGEG